MTKLSIEPLSIEPLETSRLSIEPLTIEPLKDPKKSSSDGYSEAYQKYVKRYQDSLTEVQIPGSPKPGSIPMMSEKQFRAEADAKLIDSLKGYPDAALTMLTSIPAMIAAAPSGVAAALRGENPEKAFSSVNEFLTWKPRTESGQKYVEKMGYALQPFALAPYLAPTGPLRASRAARPIEAPRNIDAIVKESKAPVPEVAPPALPEVLTVSPKGEVYVNTPEVEVARQAAQQREQMLRQEQARSLNIEPVDTLAIDNTQPFRYEGAMDAPELLSKENIKKTFDPQGEQKAVLSQEIQALTKAKDDILRSTEKLRDPERFNEAITPDLEKSRQAFTALEEQAARIKQQQMELEWTKREETLPERAIERVRREEQDTRTLSTLEDIQASLTSPRVSKGQQRKLNKQRGVVDFSLWENKDSNDPSGRKEFLKDLYYKLANREDSGNTLTLSPEQKRLLNSIEKEDRFGYDTLRQALKAIIEEPQSYDIPSHMRQAMSLGGNKFRQQGALRVQDITEGLKKFRERWGSPVQDSIKTPITEETIKAKQEQTARIAKIENILQERLPQFTDITTAEEALYLAKDSKDIASNPYTRGTASGLNFMTAYHNNPVLRYARKLFTEARGEASTFSRQYVSGKDGVSSAIKNLSKEDKVMVNDILISLDKHQVDWTPELATKLRASPEVVAYMDAHKRAFDALWEQHKAIIDAQGIKSAPQRAGYSPGVFRGTYTSLVTGVDDTGRRTVVGMIAADTPGEFMLAKEYYQKAHSESKFSANTWQEARHSFSGETQGQAFKYKNINQMINLLSSVDGDISKAQLKIAQDAVKASSELFGLDKHNIGKKGIVGNEGNKPWLSADKNAAARLDSIVGHLEDSAEYNALQKPLEELRVMMSDPSVDHLTNVKAYLDDYTKNVSGSYLNPMGNILNTAFNASHLMVEEIAAHIPGARNYIGPGNTLKISNQLKNKMSQWYMGWFNWMFTASQFAQPLQTGGPIALLAANRLDIPYADVSRSFVSGGSKYIKAMLSEHGLVDLDPQTKRTLEYGNAQGILDFTELERAYEGNKGKFERAYDKTAEVSMQVGEAVTRPPMFFSFVDMLLKVEPDLERVLPVAEHLTNQAMGDYHKWERPLMYNGLGVLAPHAGGLTTFKHNYMGTQALLAKETANLKKGELSALAPLAASSLSMLALAGITGTPFYDELDVIYQTIREKFTGEKRSISQDFLNNIEQHWKTGAVSSALDLNMQGKFSSANMIPDSLGQAAFPHLSGAWDIGKSFYEAAKNPNDVSLSNAAVAATPSGWKQAMRETVKKDPKGYLLDKTGQRDVFRTPEQWDAASITGLTPLQEATDKNRRFQNIKNERARKDKLIELSGKWKTAIISDESPQKQAEILNEYEKLGGNPVELIRQIGKIQMEAAKTADERVRGVPRSIQGIRRDEAFNN